MFPVIHLNNCNLITFYGIFCLYKSKTQNKTIFSTNVSPYSITMYCSALYTGFTIWLDQRNMAVYTASSLWENTKPYDQYVVFVMLWIYRNFHSKNTYWVFHCYPIAIICKNCVKNFSFKFMVSSKLFYILKKLHLI